MMQAFSVLADQHIRFHPMGHKTVIQFTPRECQIIGLLETSDSLQQLARRLSISESTVRFHLKNIYRKFGVRNRSGAIARARSLNMETRGNPNPAGCS